MDPRSLSILRRDTIRALLLLLAVFLTYAPSLNGGFLWDDDIYLTESPFMRAEDGLQRIWLGTGTLDYYPVSSTTLWLEWRLWGPQPGPYRVTNLALHALNALLLIALLRRLNVPGAWLAGMLMAMHPVSVEAAAWIAQRKSLLAVTFGLLSMLAWEDARRRGSGLRHAGAWLLFAASLLSKTSQVAQPLVLLALAAWRQGRLTRRDIVCVAPHLLLSLGLGLVTLHFQGSRAIGSADIHPEGLLTRVSAAGWTVLFHVYHALSPVHLAVCYPRWQVDPASITHWIPSIVCLAAAVLIWRRSHRPAWRATGAALLAYILLLAPTLGFLDIGFMMYSLVADHWQYGAMPALLALCAAGLARVSPHRARVASTFGAVWVVALAFLSSQRALAFSDLESFWRDNIRNYPQVVQGWAGLGGVLLDRGDASGEAALSQALVLRPEDAWCHARRGWWRAVHTNYPAAVDDLRQAVRLDPGKIPYQLALAMVLAKSGHAGDARQSYEEVLSKHPELTEAKVRLAWLLATAAADGVRDPDRALELLRGLPEGAVAPHIIADVRGAGLASAGRFPEAVACLRPALDRPEVAGNASIRHALAERLAAYEAGRAWKEPQGQP